MISSIISFFQRYIFLASRKTPSQDFCKINFRHKKFMIKCFFIFLFRFQDFLNQPWLLFFFFFTKLIKINKQVNFNKSINQTNEPCQNLQNCLFSLLIYFSASTCAPGLNHGFLFLIPIQTVSKAIKSFDNFFFRTFKVTEIIFLLWFVNICISVNICI